MKKILLNGAWTGCCLDELGDATFSFPATVPGCVHTDLIAAGRIENLYWRDNDDQYLWIEKSNWKFERTFTVEDFAEDSYLEFGGLDVYAEIYLNDRLLAKTDDAHISYRFPAGKLLKKGENLLEVFFRSPVLDITKKRSGAFTKERLFTRRIQCTYSWDWVGRFVTCGITGDVALVTPEKAELDTYYLFTESIDKYSAQLNFSLKFALKDHYRAEDFCEWEILSPDGKVVRRCVQRIVEPGMRFHIDIADPQLWYPNGYGAQPLYTLNIFLNRGGEKVLAATEKFGIRTLKILQLPDSEDSEYRKLCREIQATGKVAEYDHHWDKNEETSGFIVLVNGEKIFCRGGNWVPCEPFPSAEEPAKYTEILELSRDAGVNMLRVWGGGIFEKDHFYEECTRLGILVTQDFLMACGTYPEDEDWFIEHLRWETEYAVRRLRNHTCLAWWSGDNENAVSGDASQPEYTGRRSAMEGIAPVLEQYDTVRSFLPSSPFGGYPYGSATVGTTHNTLFVGDYFRDIMTRDMSDYLDYQKKYRARFSVEDPVFGTSELVSIRKFMTERDIFIEKEMWYYHSRTNPGIKGTELYDFIETYAIKAFGDFLGSDDMVSKMQYMQYEWVRISMELFRRNKWFSAGIIYWMLADCWPAAAGWSLIDYYCLPKSGYYGFKRTARPVIAAIDREEDAQRYVVWLCNDTYQPVSADAEVYVYDMAAGKKIWSQKISANAEANVSVRVFEMPVAEMEAMLNNNTILMCDLSGNGIADRAVYLLHGPKHANFPAPQVSVVAQDAESVTVRADSYLHAVHLEGNAVFEDNYFPMLAGEERKISYRVQKDETDAGVITAVSVFRK